MTQREFSILLVEDNPSHAELVELALESCEETVHLFRVNDGEEAIDFLFQKGKYENEESILAPDLVLLDLRLPKIDGKEVLRRIRENEELLEIPVAVLTTSSAEEDLTEVYDLGADYYLVKPLSDLALNKIINDLNTSEEDLIDEIE